MIARRLLNGTYHTFGEIERDFVQMARNAKHFNEPKSQIYQVRCSTESKCSDWPIHFYFETVYCFRMLSLFCESLKKKKF